LGIGEKNLAKPKAARPSERARASPLKGKNKNHFFLRAEEPAAPKSDVGGGKTGLPGCQCDKAMQGYARFFRKKKDYLKSLPRFTWRVHLLCLADLSAEALA
jgi:hypothetical protein